jgi:hypothetical protein
MFLFSEKGRLESRLVDEPGGGMSRCIWSDYGSTRGQLFADAMAHAAASSRVLTILPIQISPRAASSTTTSARQP